MISPDGSTVKTILVVDDEANITSVCRRVLTYEGFEVDIAANGKVAQDMIKKRHYALCLIDIRTPIMGGKELYGWLLQEHPQMARRVMFTTGDVVGEDTQAFVGQTGNALLPKPFTPNELKAAIREASKQV